jgi:hypothetical protein
MTTRPHYPIATVATAWLNNRGHCQCGWQGKRRIFRGAAVVDVGLHCAETGHTPALLGRALR